MCDYTCVFFVLLQLALCGLRSALRFARVLWSRTWWLLLRNDDAVNAGEPLSFTSFSFLLPQTLKPTFICGLSFLLISPPSYTLNNQACSLISHFIFSFLSFLLSSTWVMVWESNQQSIFFSAIVIVFYSLHPIPFIYTFNADDGTRRRRSEDAHSSCTWLQWAVCWWFCRKRYFFQYAFFSFRFIMNDYKEKLIRGS